MELKNIQGKHTARVFLPAHLAATATEKRAILSMPFRCNINRVAIAPQTAVTGADTNTTHLNVIDGGADGTGTTEIGALDLTSGNDLVALDDNDIIARSAADVAMDADDVLVLQHEKVGTGLDVLESYVLVEYEAR